MGKKIFDEFVDFINNLDKRSGRSGRNEYRPDKGDCKTDSDKVRTNAIDKMSDLINGVKVVLKSNYKGQNCSFDDKELVIYILDNLFYDSIDRLELEKKLLVIISDDLGYGFAKVEVLSGKLQENESYSKVSDDIYLKVSQVNKATVRKANIIPQEGYGSTIDENYLLDSDDLAKRPGARYNIGAGRHPKMDDFLRRENYIAIDDCPESAQFENNKYVSRAHAYISFNEKYGFMLHAEFGGTRIAGKRLHIYRGEQKIELENTIIAEPLQDGDYIVLSKRVHLLFKECHA